MATTILDRGRLASALICDSVLFILSIPAFIVGVVYLEQHAEISFSSIQTAQWFVLGWVFGLGYGLLYASITYVLWLLEPDVTRFAPAIFLIGAASVLGIWPQHMHDHSAVAYGTACSLLFCSLWIFYRFRR